MADLIDRETAIHRIYNEVNQVSNDGSPDHRKIEVWAQLVMEGLFRAVRIVKEMKAEEPGGGRWIPCSERLPEIDQLVLITNKYGCVRTLQRIENGWLEMDLSWFNDEEKPDYVKAWMPLPEPWKGEEDGGSD